MLILIICIILTLTGFALMYISENCRVPDWFNDAAAFVAGVAISAIFTVALFTMSVCIIYTASTDTYNKEVLDAKYESIEIRLEKTQEASENSIMELNSLYNDIYEYNMKVKSIKYYGNSPWTNWFYGRKTVKESKYFEVDTD